MKCVREKCRNKARPDKYQGLCEKHYEASSEHGFVPAAPVVEHYMVLRKTGLSCRRIADMAGLNRATLHMLGEWTDNSCVRAETAQKLLSLPIPNGLVDGGALVDATGTKRRLHALMAIGWPIWLLAEKVGISRYTLEHALFKSVQVKAKTAAAVAGLFDTLQMTPGPSEVTKRCARKRGWVLPFQWDEDEIDDPTAEPYVGENRWVPFMERYQELKELSLSDSEIASKLGIQLESVERTLRRNLKGAA